MKKNGYDIKVKKTLNRNFEHKQSSKQLASHDTGSSSKLSKNTDEQSDLNQPTLCSSKVLANYLSDIKQSLPIKPNVLTSKDKSELGAKVTKKLNFHYNDRIYKNLVELNANTEEIKVKKGKRPPSGTIKRDLEPNIEDFCQEDHEPDMIPTVPIIKPKFKPIKKVYDGYLHKLAASFEDL